MKEYSAIILAGGKSSRMGNDKADLLIDGKSFVRILTDKLSQLGIRDVMLSGYQGEVSGARNVADLFPGKGPMSGIHAGLCAARQEHVLVLAVDTPLIPQAFLERLLACHDHGITVATCNGRVQPLVAVVDRRLSGECERLLAEERHSMMSLYDKVGYQTVPFSGEELLIRGCNTPEEYEAMEALERTLVCWR